jgi:hypothetical protein
MFYVNFLLIIKINSISPVSMLQYMDRYTVYWPMFLGQKYSTVLKVRFKLVMNKKPIDFKLFNDWSRAFFG